MGGFLACTAVSCCAHEDETSTVESALKPGKTQLTSTATKELGSYICVTSSDVTHVMGCSQLSDCVYSSNLVKNRLSRLSL